MSKKTNENVGTNDICPICKRWIGPVHIGPEHIARNCEIQADSPHFNLCKKCGGSMSLWCDNDIKERNFDEVMKLREQVESTRKENERLQRVESEIDAWVSAHDGDISQVDAIDIIIKAAIKAEADWLDATPRP